MRIIKLLIGLHTHNTWKRLIMHTIDTSRTSAAMRLLEIIIVLVEPLRRVLSVPTHRPDELLKDSSDFFEVFRSQLLNHLYRRVHRTTTRSLSSPGVLWGRVHSARRLPPYMAPRDKYTTHISTNRQQLVCVYAAPFSVSMAVRVDFNYPFADFIGNIIIPSSPYLR